MTTEDIYKGLLSLSDKLLMGSKPTTLDHAIVLEAAAFILEQVARSQERHPAHVTSNGDPIATYWNNVVSIKKAGM